MKLGFLTGCLGDIPLEEKVDWAKQNGFSMVEISCWPRVNTRDYSGTDIDVTDFNEEKARKIRNYLDEKNIGISALAYYDNNLHADLEVRKSYHSHLKKVIDAAQMLGVELVGTFVGRNMNLTIEDNFKEFEEVFGEFLEYAAKRNVKLMIENCPMPGWHKDGWAGTISYSPELWDEMFRRLPNENLGLNFDPSHLLWLQVDYLDALKKYMNRIFHIHLKDTKVVKEWISYYSILGKQLDKKNEWDTAMFIPKMPGLGDVDWDNIFRILREENYNGAISIEHEDPTYEGSIEKVKEGLLIARDFINKYI